MWYPGKNIIEGIQDNRELKNRSIAAGGQPAPQYDQGGLAAFQGAAAQGSSALGNARGMQGDTFGMYRDMAQGGGPSLAQAQLGQQNAQNVATQQAMAAQGSGGNLAAMQRGAAGVGAAGAMAGQQQLAQLRAQEQQAAMAGMAGMSNTMAGQGLQQQGMGLGLLGQAHGQQLGANTQWGLGQRGMDIEQLGGNRDFGLGMFDQVRKTVFGEPA